MGIKKSFSRTLCPTPPYRSSKKYSESLSFTSESYGCKTDVRLRFATTLPLNPSGGGFCRSRHFNNSRTQTSINDGDTQILDVSTHWYQVQDSKRYGVNGGDTLSVL